MNPKLEKKIDVASLKGFKQCLKVLSDDRLKMKRKNKKLRKEDIDFFVVHTYSAPLRFRIWERSARVCLWGKKLSAFAYLITFLITFGAGIVCSEQNVYKTCMQPVMLYAWATTIWIPFIFFTFWALEYALKQKIENYLWK